MYESVNLRSKYTEQLLARPVNVLVTATWIHKLPIVARCKDINVHTLHDFASSGIARFLVLCRVASQMLFESLISECHVLESRNYPASLVQAGARLCLVVIPA